MRRIQQKYATATLLILALSFGVGCGGSDRDPLTERQLDIDPSLLGAAVTDSSLGMTFLPPAELQAAEPAFIQRVQRELRGSAASADSFFIIPAMIFAVPEQDTRIFVSEFSHPPADGPTPEWRDRYLKRAKEKAAGAEVETESYRIGDLEFHQFLVRDFSFVNHRLVCYRPGGPMAQVDYLIPRADYERLLPAIESSIGSIELF